MKAIVMHDDHDGRDMMRMRIMIIIMMMITTIMMTMAADAT